MFYGLTLWRGYEMLLTFWHPCLVGMWRGGGGGGGGDRRNPIVYY